jgi:hypothetical protein
MGAGLSKLEKKTNKNEKLTYKKIWKYGIIISFIYIYLKKVIFLLKNFHKN